MRPETQSAAPGVTEDEPPSGVVAKPDFLASVPRLAVSKEILVTLPLNHRAGFIVSFVDGSFTVEMILDACAMRRDEALAILGELVSRGIVCFG
jgi:hypothetical protein